MPNPKFRTNQFSYSFAQPEHLFVKVNIGASGAPTIVANTGMGIESISRSSAGVYVVRLSHAYNALLGVAKTNIVSSGLAAAPDMAVKTDAVSNSAVPAVTLTMSSGGVATDPANGESIILEISLQKSSVRF